MFRAIASRATATASAVTCISNLERKASGAWLSRTNLVASDKVPYTTSSTSNSGRDKRPLNGQNDVVDGASWTSPQDYTDLSSDVGLALDIQHAPASTSQADSLHSNVITSTKGEIVRQEAGTTIAGLSQSIDTCPSAGTSVEQLVSVNSEGHTKVNTQHVKPVVGTTVPEGEPSDNGYLQIWNGPKAKLDNSIPNVVGAYAKANGASIDKPGNQIPAAIDTVGISDERSNSTANAIIGRKSVEDLKSIDEESLAELYISRSESLSAVQNQINYKFINPKWLVWAISKNDAIHNGEYIPDMQKYLAIIGDTVLKGAYYIQNFPYQHLSALHAPFGKISSNDALAGIMFDSGLLQSICPAPQNGYRTEKIATWDIATILEAIIGAVYMDSGKDYITSRSVIESILELVGINGKDGSPLKASNCGKRETFSSLSCRMINSIVHTEVPKANLGLPTHLGHKDLLLEQAKFVNLRKTKAKLLNELPPRDYILKKIFRHNLYRLNNFEEVLRIEKDEIADLERKADNGSLLDKKTDMIGSSHPLSQSDYDEVRSGNTNHPVHQQSRLELFDIGLATAKTEKEFQARRRRIESILGYTFQDTDMIRMSISNASFVHKDRNIPNPQEHLAYLGNSILRLVFYQHNLSYRGYGPELRQIYIAISSSVNLAYIFENLGLFKATFTNSRPQGLRADLRSTTPLIKTLAVTLEAMLGAVWLDSGSNYMIFKSVMEKILWQKGDEDKAGSALDWQRVLARQNVHWPRDLRNNSPLREHFSKDDIEFDEVELADPT